MRIKKAVLIAIIGVIVLIGIFFSYKLYLTNRYNYKTSKSLDLKMADTWKIDHKEFGESDYLKLGSIQIKDEFNDFEKIVDEDSQVESYILKDISKNAGLSYIKFLTLISTLSKSDFTDDEKKGKVFKEFLDDHEFKNDVELIKYIVEFKEDQNSILSSTKKIKENYVVKYLKDNVLVNGTFHPMEGKYTGYVTEDADKYEVNIIEGDTKYTITFRNKSYFPKEKVIELVSSIKI